MSEEVSLVGDAPATEVVAVIADGSESSAIRRRSLRKLSRGRLAKSSPKSPLMRMAEMRKGGLRGRVLRHSGKKGFDGAESGTSKGKKGNVGKSSGVLVVIPENTEVGDEVLEGLGEGGLDGVEVAMMVDRRLKEADDRSDTGSSARRHGEVFLGQDWGKELIPSGSIADCALDLVAAQPMQEMSFVAEQVTPEVIPVRSCVVEEVNLAGNEGGVSANASTPEKDG